MRYEEPEELPNIFCRCADVRDRDTRQYGRPHMSRCQTAYGQHQFAYRAAKLLSALPTDLTDRPVIPTYAVASDGS